MKKSLLILRLLQIRLYTISDLRKLTKNNINFREWHQKTLRLLQDIFGDDQLVNNFKKIKYAPVKRLIQEDLKKEDFLVSYQAGLAEAEIIIREAINRYMSTCMNQMSVAEIKLENNFDLSEIEEIIEALDFSSNEKEKIKQELKEVFSSRQKQQVVQNGNCEVVNNNRVAVYNKLQPGAGGFIVFSSLLEIIEAFLL